MLTMTPLDRSGFVHTYGQTRYVADYYDEPTADDAPPPRDYRQGVASDHLAAVLRLPDVRVVPGALCAYVVDDAADGVAYPVLCSEVVEVWTEDGPSDGRCGLLATDQEVGSCASHAEERRQWAALTEAERAHWEREHDRVHP